MKQRSKILLSSVIAVLFCISGQATHGDEIKILKRKIELLEKKKEIEKQLRPLEEKLQAIVKEINDIENKYKNIKDQSLNKNKKAGNYSSNIKVPASNSNDKKREQNEASSEIPYWAGHKAELSVITPDGDLCELTIEYTSDGKHYSASLEVPTNEHAAGGGSCRGLVDKDGNLERKDCTPGIWNPRNLAGTVTKPILEAASTMSLGPSTAGGCKWADKTLQKKS